MKEKFEELCDLPLSYRLGILGGLIVLIAGVYWMNFYTPLVEELTDLDEKISGPNGLKVQIAQQEGIAANLDNFEEEVERLDIELKKALQELPDSREIHQLLSRISDRARDAGLDVHLFKPQGEIKREFYAEVPAEIQVAGSFHEVATFFDEVGHLERIVNLDRFTIEDPIYDEEEVLMKTSVVATAFRFLDESERPQERRRRKARQETPPQRW